MRFDLSALSGVTIRPKQVDTVFFARSQFVKVDDLSRPIHQAGLVVPQRVLLGSIGLFLYRQIRIACGQSEREQIKRGVVLMLGQSTVAHELACLRRSMRIQRAAQLL